MGIRKSLAVLAVVCLLLGSIFSTVALAAEKSDPGTVGLVDLERILQDYEKKKAYDAEVKAFVTTLQEKFDLRNRNKLLNEQEMAELESLKFKEKPTEKELARITELENIEKARDNELKDLQSKKEPTDADKARLAELQGFSKKSDENLTKLANEYAKQIEDKRNELGKVIETELIEAIKVVAQEKGINTVVDKVAVLYGGVDITTAVLEKLNKK